MGTMHAMSILKNGYQGKLFIIHPRDEKVLGLNAYKSINDLPEIPDLGFIVVPSEHLPSLMEEFGKKGTKSVIVITAGFKETGAHGKEQEELLNTIANKYGISFVGPNCMGVLNSQISLNTTVMRNLNGPGMLGFASQSGTYVTQVMSYLKERGIRFSKAISVGNEANLGIIDALEYLGEDEATTAISLYIEGLKDVPRFLEVARKITQHKPVLAQYIGGSEAGARSGKSHTGALAGPDHMYDGLFKQAGIIRVDSIEELYSYGWALASQPRLRGKRIGIITNSGGPGSAMANICDNGGLEIPVFSEKLQEELKPMIPPHAPSGNPVDLTFSMDVSILTNKIPEAVMKSGEIDGILIHGAMSSGFIKCIYPHIKDLLNNTPLDDLINGLKPKDDAYLKLPFKYGIPLAISSWFQDRDNVTEEYQMNNIPTLDSPEKAAYAMVNLFKYKKVTERTPYKKPAMPAVSEEGKRIIEKAIKNNQTALDEYEAKKLLSLYGIPVSKEKLAADLNSALAAADDITYPVAVKVCSREILHKTESGMVFLNRKNKEEVTEAFNLIQEKAGKNTPVLISSMVKGDREMLCGMVKQKGFGTCVVFGIGGIFAEALNDTSFRIAPVALSEAEEMIDDIRAKKLLGKFRGMPAVDRNALSCLIQALSFLPFLHPEIAEVDINPLIINGSQPVAVDALIVLEKY
jgi:acetyltransferase